jgi:S-adenosylmethionine:tRNA ribosyltransferase-isomerase
LSIADYTYHLPEERIARFPLEERDESKLLVYRNGKITADVFAHLPDYTGKDDLMVFNNTRVLHARIEMAKESGARIEILCLEPYDPADYQLSLAQQSTCLWKCMVGNLKKWKQGTLRKQISPGMDNQVKTATVELCAERIAETEQCQVVRFTWDSGIDFGSLLDACGTVPVPPYLNRKAEAIDDIRYQTVYSKQRGSVAAPTAGLHFTPQVLQQLKNRGVAQRELTLHVGAGTFRPVQQDNVFSHEMHQEFFTVPLDVIQALLACRGTITAVGTTSLRTLETIYWLGVKLLQNGPGAENPHLKLDQWEDRSLPQNVSMEASLTALCNHLEKNRQDALKASTKIMIVPPYTFRVCRRLLTNFHQPHSTLLLLIAAFVGPRWKEIYQHALEHDFRFLSYGDSSCLDAETSQETA